MILKRVLHYIDIARVSSLLSNSHVLTMQIQVYDCGGNILRNLSDPETLGSVCSLNVFHPTQNILVGGNSSGRVHVFM